jgi:hypothetical protein
MSSIVRAVLARRNPKNVPLDVFDAGGPDPFPYPFEGPGAEGLNQDEKVFRSRANRQHAERMLDTYPDRRATAREEYVAILSEIVRSLGEKAYRLQSSGLLRGSLEIKNWIKLGRELGSLCRDASAALYVIHVLDYDLFQAQRTAKVPIGKLSTHHTGEQLREAFEVRVALIERWITARAAFEARGEIMATRALHATDEKAKAPQAIESVERLVVKAQSGISSGSIGLRAHNISSVSYSIWDIFFAVAEVLSVLNDPDLPRIFDQLLETPIRTLEAGVKKIEKLAAKGEPKNVSRKLARAEEARTEALEVRKNPFAGYRTFKACTRDKAEDPRVFSPGAVCATIERRGKGSIVNRVVRRA